MNLLITTGIFPPDVGGPATYVPRVARGLRDRGWGVEVITPGTDEPEESFPFVVHRVPRSPLSRIPRVLALLRRRADWADSVYVNGLATEVQMGRLLGGLPPGVRKIVGDRAWERYRNRNPDGVPVERYPRVHPPPLNRLYRALHRAGTRREGAVTVPSHFLKDVVMEWGLPGPCVTVIRNAVHPPSNVPGASPDWPGERGTKLLTAGRLVPWKRTAELIDRVAEVPSVRLVVLGDGPRRESCEERVRAGGIGHRVRLAGNVSRGVVWQHLREADLFLLHSTYEGFPHVLLECVATGTPVLAANAGGTAELAGFFPEHVATYPRGDSVRLTERLRAGDYPGPFEPPPMPPELRWETILDRTDELLASRVQS